MLRFARLTGRRALSRCLSSSPARIPKRGAVNAAREKEQSTLNNAITLALAPPSTIAVNLPESYTEDLDQLYEALTSPLKQPPTRSERHSAHRRINTSPEAFFKRRERDADSYALLIRCLGHQRELGRAIEAIAEMRELGIPPSGNTVCALVEACARVADVAAAEEAISFAQAEGIRLSAPMFTSLIQAHRRAGSPLSEARAVLQRMRAAGVAEDAPTHTALICAYVKAGEPEEAWEVYDGMIERGIRPDVVTFSAMMAACEAGDQLEQADGLFVDMEQWGVLPTKVTHIAYIQACAARCKHLAHLGISSEGREKRKMLHRMRVDTDPIKVLDQAFRQLGALQDDGFAPDEFVLLALLRACSAAGEVGRAQRLLTQMLDQSVTAHRSHFHTLLRTCARAHFIHPGEREAHMQVALAVPSSMEALGIDVVPATIDLVIEVHAAAHEIARSIDLLTSLYEQYGLSPTAKAYDAMLRMAYDLQRPELARELLADMQDRGISPSEGQARIPSTLEQNASREYINHPRLPAVAWNPRQGHYIPTIPERTAARWRTARGLRSEGDFPEITVHRGGEEVRTGRRYLPPPADRGAVAPAVQRLALSGASSARLAYGDEYDDGYNDVRAQQGTEDNEGARGRSTTPLRDRQLRDGQLRDRQLRDRQLRDGQLRDRRSGGGDERAWGDDAWGVDAWGGEEGGRETWRGGGHRRVGWRGERGRDPGGRDPGGRDPAAAAEGWWDTEGASSGGGPRGRAPERQSWLSPRHSSDPRSARRGGGTVRRRPRRRLNPDDQASFYAGHSTDE